MESEVSLCLRERSSSVANERMHDDVQQQQRERVGGRAGREDQLLDLTYCLNKSCIDKRT